MAYMLPAAWYLRGSTGINVADIGTYNNAAGATLGTGAVVSCPAGATVIVCVSEATASTIGTVSDGTNSYAPAASEAMSGNVGVGGVFYYYYSGAQTNITLTYTKSTTGDACSISVFWSTGLLAVSPIDSAVTAVAQSTSATPSLASGTPGGSGELIVAMVAYDYTAAAAYTQPVGFTTPPDASTAQFGAQLGGGCLNAAATLPVTFAPTLAHSTTGSALIIVGFKPAAAQQLGWWAVTPWASGTPAAGVLRRQNVTPAVNSERVFACIVSAGSQATEPAWVVTKGAITTDGAGNKWQECTGQPGVNGDISAANCPVWIASVNPPLGLIIYESTFGSLQICNVSSGNSLASVPTFSATAGVVTNDSANRWTSLGLASGFAAWAAPFPRIIGALTANWVAAGNTVWVSDDHAETQATSISMAVGTLASPVKVLCVDHTAAVPPGNANLKTTASITSTGGSHTN